MSWEDWGISLCGVGMGLFLLPSLLSPTSSVPLTTSIPSGCILLVMAWLLYQTELPVSALVQAMIAGIWFAIAVFRHP